MKQMLKTKEKVLTLGFTKEKKLWYADLPEFIEKGLGTKANLMMVDGADTFLDYLTGNGTKATIQMSSEKFSSFNAVLKKESNGLNQDILNLVGHAPVNYGAYYKITEYNKKPFQHRIWLCPVTEYVFGGDYPETIFIKVIDFE